MSSRRPTSWHFSRHTKKTLEQGTPRETRVRSTRRWRVAMPRASHSSVPEIPLYSADLEEAMQDTLSRLADVDLIYELRCEMLDNLSDSKSQTQRLRAEAEAIYQSERQPLILRLADLHDRMMTVTLFRTHH